MASTAGAPVWFATLTYQGNPSVVEAREDLRVWAQTVGRIYRRAGIPWAVVWRLELTKAGRPHFHLLVWEGAPARTGLLESAGRATREQARATYRRLRNRSTRARSRPSRRWCDRLAVMTSAWLLRSADRGGDVRELERRSVDLRSIRDPRQVTAYVAKYIAKVDPSAEVDPGAGAAGIKGRHWGRCGDRAVLAATTVARLDIPAIAERVEAAADTLADWGSEFAAGAMRGTFGTLVLLAPVERLVDLVARLGLWGVPPRRGPPVVCRHTSCLAG